jgi:hypothetical protein
MCRQYLSEPLRTSVDVSTKRWNSHIYLRLRHRLNIAFGTCAPIDADSLGRSCQGQLVSQRSCLPHLGSGLPELRPGETAVVGSTVPMACRGNVTQEECSKHGAVLGVVVPKPPDAVVAAGAAGRCYISFAEQAGAIAAQRALHGRTFGGNKVRPVEGALLRSLLKPLLHLLRRAGRCHRSSASTARPHLRRQQGAPC